MCTQRMQLLLLAVLLTGTTLCHAQLFYHHQTAQPFQGFAAAPVPSRSEYAHPTVVRNAEREAQLPPELQKSARFYNNPAIAAALAKESWPTDKESIVLDREAEKIPRDMVLKIFKNAGWARRR